LINGAIRCATSTGRPLGIERFIKKLEGILNRDISLKRVASQGVMDNIGSVPMLIKDPELAEAVKALKKFGFFLGHGGGRNPFF